MSLLSDWWKKLTEQTPATVELSAPDTSAVDAVFTGAGEFISQTGTYLTKDLPETLANPYDAFSYKPGEGELGKSLQTISMEQLGFGMPDFGMGGIGGSGGGGGDNGGGSTDTSTETTMTASEKRDKLRQLMASRYGKRETILTSGTGVAGFGV